MHLFLSSRLDYKIFMISGIWQKSKHMPLKQAVQEAGNNAAPWQMGFLAWTLPSGRYSRVGIHKKRNAGGSLIHYQIGELLQEILKKYGST